MKIFQILPRRMTFSRNKASSVELCVSEWVSGSRFRQHTTVFAERGDAPLIDVALHRWQPASKLVSWRTALEIRREAARRGCDLIVVQQHIATAARIAAFNPKVPVVLSTHNYIAPPRTGHFAAARNALTEWELNRLAGVTVISGATKSDFGTRWPKVAIPRAVVSNGFDFEGWRPREVREKIVIAVGRAIEEKGLLEAAAGIGAFLAGHPDWRAALVLAGVEHNPAYFQAIKDSLAPYGAQVDLLSGVPYERVRDISERCAIAVVPSKWNEPFGRTALEAHAGGAALVSSGSGGLREISGPCAIYLDEVSGGAIDKALRILAADEELARRLAREGAARVRELFRISGPNSICARLDSFFEQVVAGSAG